MIETKAKPTKRSLAPSAGGNTSGVGTWLFVGALSIVQFVDVLSSTLMVVALPSVQADMQLTSASAEMLAGLFALLFGALLILGGKVSDVFGARRMLILGLVLFVMGSLVGGLAPVSVMLFAGRSIQGISAALAVPAALALLLERFPAGPVRNRALAVWTASGAAGGVAGLAAGGVLTEALGWRSIFLVLVPVVLLALIAVIWMTSSTRSDAEHRAIDIRGSLLLAGGLLASIMGMSNLRTATDEGHVVTSGGTVLVGIAMLRVFVLMERSTAVPLIPVRLLRSPGLVGAALVASTLTFTTSAATLMVTFYLQGVLEIQPSRAGLLLVPFSVVVVVGSSIGSRLTSARGFGVPMTIGLLAIAASMLIHGIGMHADDLRWIVSGFALSGLGIGIASVASTACGLARIDGADTGTASGLTTSAAMLGTAIGIAVLGAIAAAGTMMHGSQADIEGASQTVGYQLAVLVAGVLAVAMVPIAIRSSRQAWADGS